MKKTLAAIVAATVLIPTGAAVASGVMGAEPREVNLNIPCQRPNQLNCTWYGERVPVGTSETPPVYTKAYWFNYADPDGKTFCRYRVTPIRQLTCADHWPLTIADEFGTKN